MHGYMDYLVGILLIAAPWLFNFSDIQAATWTAVLIGAGTIVYSIMTDYELGMVPLISMPAHLRVDALAGIVLLLSPWLFGFASAVWGPHVVVGIVEVLAALTTHQVPAAHGRSRTSTQ